MRRVIVPAFIVAHLLGLHLAVVWLRSGDQAADPTYAPLNDDLEPTDGAPFPASAANPTARPTVRPGALDLENVHEDGEKLMADLGNGFQGELTLAPRLQREAKKILDRGKMPLGAVVVLDIASGNVLALADRYRADHPSAPPLPEGGPQSLALRSIAPAASIFKIVTATALLEAGVSGNTEFAYLGGLHRVGADHLKVPGAGAPTATLGDGLSKSINGLISRLANDKLDFVALDGISRRFQFNTHIPFDAVADASTATVPRLALERARMAAGFFHSTLTPLHGALLAASIANGGIMPRPRLVSRIHHPDGTVEQAPAPAPLATVTRPETAKQIARMLRATTEDGTGRRAFAHVPKSLEGIDVAGKTGTLTVAQTVPLAATDYTWFVGFAPADAPTVAFAVLVGNGPLWSVRATDVARDVLAVHFEGKAIEAAIATR